MERYAKRYINMKYSHPDITERMPNDAETALYNTLFTYKERNVEVFAKLDRLVWTNFFNYRIDEYEPKRFGPCILDEGFHGNCILKFAIIDFLLQEIDNLRETEEKEIPSFEQELNKEFERVNYGYRIINNHVVPITDAIEKDEIEKAIDEVTDNVKEHLNKALQFLSDKKSTDYRNSVKESLSAVEAFCYKFTKKVTLTDSLKVLDKKGVFVSRCVQLRHVLQEVLIVREYHVVEGMVVSHEDACVNLVEVSSLVCVLAHAIFRGHLSKATNFFLCIGS